MFRKFSWILLILIIAVLGCSKFNYRTPYEKFDHDKHVDTFLEEDKGCFFCHKLPDIDTLVEDTDETDIATELKIYGKCHTCHKDDITRVDDAPNTCVTCHENMDLLKPADHINNWKNIHAVPAALNKKDCENCHDDWYCESCHSRQYSFKKMRHSRSFKLKHALEAMIDPGSCNSCHKGDFCADCHLRK